MDENKNHEEKIGKTLYRVTTVYKGEFDFAKAMEELIVRKILRDEQDSYWKITRFWLRYIYDFGRIERLYIRILEGACSYDYTNK